jgi:predicted negative regulator of RcsB-dependent stress response
MIAPLPPASTAILPDNEAGLARLVRLLAVKKGFQLYVLVCPEPRERDRLIARLADEPGLAGRPVLRVDLAEYGPSAAAPADVPSLEARLHAEAGADAIVHLVNGDGWLKPDRIAELNLHRNALAAQVPASLLWWLPEVTVTELARGAPDVWSWRSGVVAFEGAGEVPEPISASPPVARSWFEVRGMSRDEKDARLAELEQVLPHIKRAELRRDLLLELADILVMVGRLDEALHVLRQQLLPMLSDDESGRAVVQTRVADILEVRGELDEALRILTDEVLPAFEKLGDVRAKAVTQGQIADILMVRGQLDEALRIRTEEELPVYEELGDVREKAVTQGKIADILMARGQLDEALRIRTEEELPVYEKVGEVRSKAVTQGQIADILMARGQLDEALRIRTDEVLPAFEKLGDVREKAVTQGKISDILMARGKLDEALRLLADEVLPAFEKLGDVRSKAVTQGKIADILMARGKLDEALRIRTEEQLPVYEKLSDVRGLLVARAGIGITLQKRNAPGDRAEARRLLALALDDARRLKLPQETAAIESWLSDLDDPA